MQDKISSLNNNKDEEEFQSFQEQSGESEDEVRRVQYKNIQSKFISKDLQFPKPQKKTLQIYALYQKNKQLITRLKNKILQLQELKKNNFFIKYDFPQINIDQQPSQFVLKSQETYHQRKRQLIRLKQEYKSTNSEQLRTAMIKNDNIKNISSEYFKEYRQVIETKSYEKCLILLTVEKRCTKDKRNDGLKQQLRKTEMNKKRSSNQKEGLKVTRTKGWGKQNERGKGKRKYNVRFISYEQIFPELNPQSSEQTNGVKQKLIKIAFTQNQRPVSFSYNETLKLFLVVLQNNQILSFVIKPLENDQVNSLQNINKGLRLQRNEQSLKIDEGIKIIFVEFKNSNLFVITNDGIIRVYQAMLNKNHEFEEFKISKILSCFNCQTQMKSVNCFSFSKFNSNQLIFAANSKILSKVNTSTFKTDTLHSFEDQILYINETVVETTKNIYLDYVITGRTIKLTMVSKLGHWVYGNFERQIQNRIYENKVRKENEQRQRLEEGRNGYKWGEKFVFCLQRKKERMYILVLKDGKIVKYMEIIK